MLNCLSSSAEAAPLTANAAAASSSVTDAEADTSMHAEDTRVYMRGGDAEAADSFDYPDLMSEDVLLSPIYSAIRFAACISVGFFINIIAVWFFLPIPSQFVAAFALGNIIFIASTKFLLHPLPQLKNMCSPQRAPAAAVYLTCMLLAFYCALGLRSYILAISCVIVQPCALVYYGEARRCSFRACRASHL